MATSNTAGRRDAIRLHLGLPAYRKRVVQEIQCMSRSDRMRSGEANITSQSRAGVR